jgi:hypothetical protein
MEDKLVKCDHCGSEMCYSVKMNEDAWAYSCTGCGFTANDVIREGGYDIEKFEEQMPELYKDLKFVDKHDRVWYPMVIQNEVGVVFIDGTDEENWGWAGIKNMLLTEEEKQVYIKESKPVPPFKSDGASLKHFGKVGFLEALNYTSGV